MIVLNTYSLLLHAIVTYSASAQFIVEPVTEPVVLPEGLMTEFECLYNSTSQVTYVWLVNEVIVQSGGVDTQFESTPAIGSPSILSITALPQHNGSVQCEATVREGGLQRELSETATLLVQDFGPLSATLSSSSSVEVSWCHLYPPSVDYFVDVRGSDGLIVQSQLVSNTGTDSPVRFTFTTPADRGICEEYNITVTPTDGTYNSSFMQSTEQYLSSEQSAVEMDCVNANGEIQCNINFNSPLDAEECVVSLALSSSADEGPLLDDVPEATVNLVSNGQQHMVTLPSNFPSNRLYTANTIFIIDEMSDVINSQTISTHDIVSATAAPGSEPGSLDTSATFVPGTTATGYLAIIANQTCSEAIFLAVNDTGGASDNLEGVGPGIFRATFFDIESNGLPMISGENNFTGAAAMVDVSLSSGNRNSTLHKMPLSDGSLFSINQMGNDVCVVCKSGACLFLLYDCDNPDVLISVKLDRTGTSGQLISESDLPVNRSGSAIGAVFLIDSETSQLSRHPVVIQFFSFAAPTVPTTSIICLLVAASLIL